MLIIKNPSSENKYSKLRIPLSPLVKHRNTARGLEPCSSAGAADATAAVASAEAAGPQCDHCMKKHLVTCYKSYFHFAKDQGAFLSLCCPLELWTTEGISQ